MLYAISSERERGSTEPRTHVDRMARDLNVLFKINKAINSFPDVTSLQVHLLELIGEVIPADAGAVLIMPRIDADPSSMVDWHRNEVARRRINIRREVVIRSLCGQSAVVAAFSPTWGDREWVLCAPLTTVQKVLGAIYLVASGKQGFPEENIHLLSSVAGVAAVAIENILTLDSLRSENSRLREERSRPAFTMIGQSGALHHLKDLIAKVAPSDSSVLIHGESGTGKELVANAIHQSSARCEKPFVAINCAAIPDSLLESELFGYERGAFTGATSSKPGKLELAKDGTVFLDEVGELAPALQAKLLRALQCREFERLGGTQPVRFDARIVAATNKNLDLALKEGELRRDLFYRLNVVSIAVPPLRDRREDIPLLAAYFATKYAQKCANRQVRGISPEARASLMNYSWPGNIRELENAIEYAMVMGSGDEILPSDLPRTFLEPRCIQQGRGRYYDSINRLKRSLVVGAIDETRGNYPEAARLLGIHPNYLHRLVRSFHLDASGAQATQP